MSNSLPPPLSPDSWPFDLELLTPPVYLVGGAVRDALLLRRSPYFDLDFVMLTRAVKTARKIADLALEFNKPVGLGISGPGMTRLQAEDRIERGKAAVEAVVKLHQRLQKI